MKAVLRRPLPIILFMQENSDKINTADWKFFGMNHKFFKLFIFITFVGVIIIIFNWMYSNYYYTNPYVPYNSGLQGSNLYGRNMEGDLLSYLKLYLIENTVVLAVLLPYSFCRLYWVRLVILQFLFGCWLFLLLLVAMHSGSLYMINLFGVFLINVLIFILLISSVIAETKNKKKIR